MPFHDDEDVLAEAVAVERVRVLSALLAQEAGRLWHIGDGEGGYVRDMIEDAFDEAGLRRTPYAPSTSRPRHPIGPNARAQVYARDGLKCVTCGSTDALTVDHIVPHVLGGSDDIDNLQTLCQPCNSRKGARTA